MDQVKKGRIKPGSVVLCDFRSHIWPNMFGDTPADPDTVFILEGSEERGWGCRADGFGARTWKGEPGKYGNGCLYVCGVENVRFLLPSELQLDLL